MILQITKNTGKPHIIKYIRDDQTETWMQSDGFFVRHDLSHYAIESILNFRTAFNGMLNKGMDIKDFENKDNRMALAVTSEAFYAENMANLFLIEIAQGEFPDFNAVQQQSLLSFASHIPVITLAEEKINAIRTYLRQLLQQWEALPAGNLLVLSFSL